jgi:hypothetical protein
VSEAAAQARGERAVVSARSAGLPDCRFCGHRERSVRVAAPGRMRPRDLDRAGACFRDSGIPDRASASPRTQASAWTRPTLASVISGPYTGRSESTDRARPKTARRRSGEDSVSGARFSRNAQARPHAAPGGRASRAASDGGARSPLLTAGVRSAFPALGIVRGTCLRWTSTDSASPTTCWGTARRSSSSTESRPARGHGVR